MRWLWSVLRCLPLLVSAPLAAIPVGTPLEFETPAQEEQYQTLIRELRCTVCQNQSLVNSNAGLAQDLRRNIYQMTRAGQDQERITEFMVSRYGDFVLYRPPLQPNTYLLWFGPILFLLVGVLVLVAMIGRQRRAHDKGLSAEERARLADLTGQRL
ncbi:MAG: cytochrome c-type biogenesis protein CcmH [Xanthomonadaceae bacterium]|nr:cytochrome c-type biogenesis protein CcmH [Xanthomonadaceae bacterium]